MILAASATVVTSKKSYVTSLEVAKAVACSAWLTWSSAEVEGSAETRQ